MEYYSLTTRDLHLLPMMIQKRQKIKVFKFHFAALDVHPVHPPPAGARKGPAGRRPMQDALQDQKRGVVGAPHGQNSSQGLELYKNENTPLIYKTKNQK